MQDLLKERLIKKLTNIKSFINRYLPERFYVAGGVFDKNHKDIDIFFLSQEDFDFVRKKISKQNNIELLHTRNAITCKYNKEIIQLCAYIKNSLEELINSFDFAHHQIGCEIKKTENDFKIEKIYYTQNFIKAKTLETTFYTGSDYPLSSLIRLMRFYKRENLAGNQYIVETFKILVDIIERGFYSYEDFKDQIDAIDLGLLPEDIKEIKIDCLEKLFLLLIKKGE